MANVKVAVRARPLLPREVEMKSPVIVEMNNQSTIISKVESGVAVGEVRDASKEFVYDHSYWSVYKSDRHFASQEQIFSDLGCQVLESAFGGYNACIFAYGQTGSGKTYTMMGSKDSPGLIPRICAGLFTGMKDENKEQVSYKVEVSYMEIYNEKVRDLLRAPVASKVNPQGMMHTLKVREHPKAGPYVENLSKHQVCDFESIQDLISTGNDQRVTAATKMNDVSSRSHAIFTILFNQAKFSAGIPSETVSKIHLVDLAGSERASQTGAEGLRLKEGGNINKSLVCLGNVISALADKASAQPTKGRVRYIPYRDSTLTWLLKDSLGGNSKTVMIATISPCEYSYSESLSTLRYASRAKNIVNKPTVNEDPNVKIIRELRDEIKRLRDLINRGDLKEATPESSLMFAVSLHNKEEQMDKMTRDWAGKWDGLQKIIEERELALESDGVKMTFASEQPHLLGIDEDVFSAGVVLYYLKTGDTNIGSDDTEGENDIVLKVDDIADNHCKIVLIDDVVCLHRINGACSVNQVDVSETTPTDLSHGDTICFGSRTYFRFNNPQEAKKLRDTSLEQNKSQSSNGSTIWSPLTNGNSRFQYARLQQERDELQQQQLAIELEYEEKIKKVLDQLRSEKEGREALEEELQKLREKKMNASIRLSASFSASTPLSTIPQAQSPDQSLMPSLIRSSLGATSSSSDSSLNFEDQFDRQVLGEEQTTPILSSKKIPQLEEYPVDSFRSDRMRSDSIHQYSVSYSDGDFRIEPDKPGKRIIDGEQGNDDYLLLETDTSSSQGSESMDGQLNEVDKLKMKAEAERDELKAHYEEKLQKEAEEKAKMQKELLELELKLQLGKDEPVSRRRTFAFLGDQPETKPTSSLSRSKPEYHSHRSSRIKVAIPIFLLRGTGWASYHVYQVEITVGRDGWRVFRTYEQFRDFHIEMSTKYPEISSLVFPPSKWFGYRTESFVTQRMVLLERYLRNFIAIVTLISSCPLSELSGNKIDVAAVQNFNGFFRPGPLTASAPPPSNTLITSSAVHWTNKSSLNQ